MKVSCLTLGALLCVQSLTLASGLPAPDIVVAADGSGNFKTIQAALASIPNTNRERTVVFVKNGVYHEKVRVDASFVTLRGQSRSGTRIEYAQLNDDFTNHPDALGTGVVNLNHANDFVMENLSAVNTAGVVGPHAFTVSGSGDQTVLQDCDLLSEGADTVALGKGEGGRHYIARCNLRGSVDFLCPRGWCYVTDTTFYETKNTAAVWHDGRWASDMKLVLKNCKFDGVQNWNLARHHVDAQFFFVNCVFSKSMTNLAPFRVIYPDNPIRNAELDKLNHWGERAYFYHCYREGGDYPWHRDNLSSATNDPAPDKLTAAWTFAGKWDPERKDRPVIKSADSGEGRIRLIFDEPVTVKGKPRVALGAARLGNYAFGSGTDTLTFLCSSQTPDEVKSVDLNGGAIVASEAGASIRRASLELPKMQN